MENIREYSFNNNFVYSLLGDDVIKKMIQVEWTKQRNLQVMWACNPSFALASKGFELLGLRIGVQIRYDSKRESQRPNVVARGIKN